MKFKQHFATTYIGLWPRKPRLPYTGAFIWSTLLCLHPISLHVEYCHSHITLLWIWIMLDHFQDRRSLALQNSISNWSWKQKYFCTNQKAGRTLGLQLQADGEAPVKEGHVNGKLHWRESSPIVDIFMSLNMMVSFVIHYLYILLNTIDS